MQKVQYKVNDVLIDKENNLWTIKNFIYIGSMLLEPLKYSTKIYFQKDISGYYPFRINNTYFKLYKRESKSHLPEWL